MLRRVLQWSDDAEAHGDGDGVGDCAPLFPADPLPTHARPRPAPRPTSPLSILLCGALACGCALLLLLLLLVALSSTPQHAEAAQSAAGPPSAARSAAVGASGGRVGPEGAETGAAASLPVCSRSLRWLLLSWSGFGSQLSSALAAASFAALTRRSFALDDRDFAYGRWSSWAMPGLGIGGHVALQERDSSWRRRSAADHRQHGGEAQREGEAEDEDAEGDSDAVFFKDGVVGVQWRGAQGGGFAGNASLLLVPVRFRAEELQDVSPVLGIDLHPTPLSPEDRRLAAVDLQLSRAPCERSVDAAALLSLHPSSAELCRAPATLPVLPYTWPSLFSDAAAASSRASRAGLGYPHVSATLVDEDDGCFLALYCPDGLQRWSRAPLAAWNIDAPPHQRSQLLSALSPAPALFFWHRRHLRSLLSLRPSLRCQAQRLLQRWSLTAKLRHGEEEGGSRYVGVHVRRGDKKVELDTRLAELERYAQAVERVSEDDGRLLRSWPVMGAANCSDASLWRWEQPWAAPMCSAWWRLQPEGASLHQPHVVLVSDDLTALHGLIRARPCWRWLAPALHERWDAEAEQWRAPARGAADSAAEGTGHQQWAFNDQPPALREASTHALLVELVLLSEAERVVLTGSSNLGRTVVLSRGWWDAHVQRRVLSLDEAVEEWRPW